MKCTNYDDYGFPVGSGSESPETAPVKDNSTKKKSKIVLWILAAVVSLLVVALIAGLCTNWFGFYGPATQIISATDKTLNAGNFTADITLTMEYPRGYGVAETFSQEIDGTVEVVLDHKNRDLMMLAELKSMGITTTLAIYDGYCMMGTSNFFTKQDISDAVDTFFENYESTKELDWEELLSSIDQELSEKIDFKKLEKCLPTYLKKLNNDKWLKENAGYSFTKENGVTRYQFRPENYAFLNASAKCFEDVFIDEDEFDILMDEMMDHKDELNSVDYELIFGIEGGTLTSFELEMDQGSSATKLDLEFDKIGETTIDEGELKTLLDKAS